MKTLSWALGVQMVLSMGTALRAQDGSTPEIFRPRHRIDLVFPEGQLQRPTTGRLVLWFIRDDAAGLESADPASGPFLDHPQPMLGATLRGVESGTTISIPGPDAPVIDLFGGLPPGGYRMRATFDWQRRAGDWSREPGNLSSEVISLSIPEGDEPPLAISIELANVVTERARPEVPGVEWVSVTSKLLSDFHLREVELRAGVVLPRDYDPNRRYPAIYYVPGFGGDDRSAERFARQDQGSDDSVMSEVRRNAFTIVLNPDSPNGHTLFADSAVNGAWGRALVDELVPELESRFSLIPSPSGRIVRGHSSGGWSAVWLCVSYPHVFGHGFSSSPDPIDFRAFQEARIEGANMYFAKADGLIGNNIRDGAARMTIRQENLMEETIGPRNTSGQQWDSWLAVFGPRTAQGLPADLFDPFTGEIDGRVANYVRRYDLGALLRADPDRLGPIFRDRIRILVGDEDQWSLHKAVALVKEDLERLGYDTSERGGGAGFVTIAPGYGHGTIFRSDEMDRFNDALLEAVMAASASGGDR